MDKNKFLIGILLVIVGLMMIVSPVACLKVLVVLVGAAVFVNGLFNVTKLRLLTEEPLFRTVITARGIFCLIAGLTAMVLPIVFVRALGSIVTLLVYLLAVTLFIAAASEIFALFQLKDSSVERRPYRTEIAATIALAVVLLLLAPNIETKLTVLFGVLLLLAGVGIAVYEYKTRPLVIEADSVRDTNEDEE